MVENHTHNLDEGVVEYFEFIVKGHKYRFKQPNTEETKEFGTFKDDPERALTVLSRFISKVDETSPDFEETAKQMTNPHWKRFNEMISEEMGLDESIKSSNTT